MRRIGIIFLVAAVGAGLVAAADRRANRPPSGIIRPGAELAALGAKFDWALGEAPKAGPGRIFWVGFSIDRLMGESSHIGSYSVGGRGRDLTVAEVLAGKTNAASSEDVRGAAKAALDRLESRRDAEKKVWKELGIFFRYEAGKTPVLSEVHITNLDLAFDFEAAPLFWLGKAPEGQSLALIERLYGRSDTDKVRQGLIAAAGCHGTPRLVVPFLAGVLAGDGSDDLRKDAAFWIGQQNDPDGLRILVKAAHTDRSKEVREGAVFSISQVDLPAAVDEIIALARGEGPRDVRKQAVFWLGQMASERSGRELEEFARRDGDIEIREQAVFALSQLPDNQGVDPLIKLAKTHPDPRIRKKAVFWLGECDDPRALQTLIAIIKGK
jgi:HEAT repeat protein